MRGIPRNITILLVAILIGLLLVAGFGGTSEAKPKFQRAELRTVAVDNPCQAANQLNCTWYGESKPVTATPNLDEARKTNLYYGNGAGYDYCQRRYYATGSVVVKCSETWPIDWPNAAKR